MELTILNTWVTKRCCLSWLTNSALVYEPMCEGRGVAGSQPMSTAVRARGVQINFGDLTPYLIYAFKGSRARIRKPFQEPRNRFPAWRAGTTTLPDRQAT